MKPLVRQDLRDGDRFALSRALAYPSAIFRVLSPEQLEEAIRVAGEHDAKIKETLRALRQEPVLEELTVELQSAREGLARAESDNGKLRSQLQESEATVLTWKDRTHRAEQEQVESGTHEIRQAHVDGMKAFAEGLAAVDRIAADSSPETVFKRLLITARTHGISPIGSRGEVVRFDPSLHHALTDVQVGDPAVIHECGFMLHEDSRRHRSPARDCLNRIQRRIGGTECDQRVWISARRRHWWRVRVALAASK